MAGQDVEMNDPDMSTSSSDSEDDDVYEPSAEEVAEMMRLESEVDANPNNYEAYVGLISILSQCRLRNRARSVREAMAARFPLTEGLWRGWIDEEVDEARTAEDLTRVELLYRRAAEDCLSVDLMVEYLEFLREYDPEVGGGTPGGLDRYRGAAEDAVTRGGMHLVKGGRVFKAYRDFELSLLSGAAKGRPRDAQLDRVRQLYTRQLALPLSDSDAALEEFRAFLAEHSLGSVPESTLQAHAKAKEAVDQRKTYEEAVSEGKTADTDLLAAYLSYIQLEELSGDPPRVCCLYERAVGAFPLTAELWTKYARYVEVTVRTPDLVYRTYDRALRHCPWAGLLWSRALRAVERGARPSSATVSDTAESIHVGLYSRALLGGWLQSPEDCLEAMLARLDFLRRCGQAAVAQLRETFSHAVETLTTLFPDHRPGQLRLAEYWSRSEAVIAKDADAGRAVWDAALKGILGRYAEGWVAAADFERRFGTAEKARQVFRRAYSRRLEEGGQLAVCEAWLRFEGEEGTADDLFQAQLRVDPILSEARAAAVAAANAEAARRAQKAAEAAPKLSREEMVKLRREKDPNFGKTKRKRAAGAAGDAGAAAEAADAPAAPATGEEEEGGHVAKKARAAPEGEEEGSPGAQKASAKPKAFTAFIKNVGFKTEEAALRAFLSEAGTVSDVRLVRDASTHRPRGLAYADFADEAGLERAVKELSGRNLEGRVLEIEVSNKPSVPGGLPPRHAPPAAAPKPSPAAAHGGPGQPSHGGAPQHPHSAYIRNIPEDATEELIAVFFAPVAIPKHVKLIRDQNTGKLKGFGYVELASAEAVEAAVRELNGKTVSGGKALFVGVARSGGDKGGAGQGGQGGGFPSGVQERGAGRGRGAPRPEGGPAGHRGLGFGGRGRGRSHIQLDDSEPVPPPPAVTFVSGGQAPVEDSGPASGPSPRPASGPSPAAGPASMGPAMVFRPRSTAVSKAPAAKPKGPVSMGAAKGSEQEGPSTAQPQSGAVSAKGSKQEGTASLDNSDFRKFLSSKE